MFRTIFLAHAALALLLAGTPAGARERMAGPGWTLTLDVPKSRTPAPLVVMLPGCSGNAPPAVRAGLEAHRTGLLARGYAAAILDVLSPRDLMSICADAPRLARLERSAAQAASDAAGRLGADPRIDRRRMAFLGQSFGGSVALRLASKSLGSDTFAAVVAYYPWCAEGYGLTAGGSDFAVPVLILSGAADTWTPVSRCAKLAPRPGSVRATVRTYPGAVHSFDLATLPAQAVQGIAGSQKVGGNAKAARASRAAFIGFLDRVLR